MNFTHKPTGAPFGSKDNAASDCSSRVDDTTIADVIVALGSSVLAVLALSLAAWQHWRGRAFRNDP
jgi:hypothetical protein